jgi:hypothetical protein
VLDVVNMPSGPDFASLYLITKQTGHAPFRLEAAPGTAYVPP